MSNLNRLAAAGAARAPQGFGCAARRQGCSRIALTFGGDGACLDVDGAQATQDVPAVTLADTVGAGDSFGGNCVGDWALQPQGAAERVAATLREAMWAAAINCTRAGCQPPRYADVQASA